MVYFNFNYVTNPPNDELVNPTTQLNANFTELDDKIKGFNTQPNTIVSPPVGTEGLFPGTPSTDNYRIGVWTGTEWIRTINANLAWEAWTTLNLLAPAVQRSSVFTPKYKINSVYARLVLGGGVLLNAAADPWPTGTTVRITATGAIPIAYAPIGGWSYQPVAVASPTGAGGFSVAQAIVDAVTDPTDVRISIRYQGDAGGGNFVMLDSLGWWFNG